MDKGQLDNYMRRVTRGDERAFEALYEGMKRGVFAFAYTYLGNRADAEDATSETFLRVKRRADSYRLGTDVRAWVFQIAKNQSLDMLRRRKQYGAVGLDEVSEVGVEQAFPLLDDMTACLSPEEKDIVILHAVWEYKHKEIAKMLSLPLGTVTWKYNEALKKLRNQERRSDE